MRSKSEDYQSIHLFSTLLSRSANTSLMHHYNLSYEMRFMIPESRLIRGELVIRDLSLPDEVLLARKSLVRWLALSLGMILPNESRILLLDVFDVLLDFHSKGDSPTTRDVLARMEKVSGQEQNPKAVYYHLQRLMESGLLTRKKGRYYFGDGEGQKLGAVFREAYLQRADKAFSNIDTVLDKLQKSY